MGNLCTRGPKTQTLIVAELDLLAKKHPQTIAGCLISEDGKTTIAHMTSRIHSNGESQEIDYQAMLPLINIYRKSATLFGQTLQHYDNRAMHIRAQQTLFSSYTIKKHTLNLLTEITPVDDMAPIELVDTKVLDSLVEEFSIALGHILEQAAAMN